MAKPDDKPYGGGAREEKEEASETSRGLSPIGRHGCGRP